MDVTRTTGLIIYMRVGAVWAGRFTEMMDADNNRGHEGEGQQASPARLLPLADVFCRRSTVNDADGLKPKVSVNPAGPAADCPGLHSPAKVWQVLPRIHGLQTPTSQKYLLGNKCYHRPGCRCSDRHHQNIRHTAEFLKRTRMITSDPVILSCQII